jgi:hypothetical protein
MAPCPIAMRSRSTRGWRWSTTASPTATLATVCSCSPPNAPRSLSSIGSPAPTSSLGHVARRSGAYQAPDHDRTIALAVGGEVILRRNQQLTQPDYHGERRTRLRRLSRGRLSNRIYATRDRTWIDVIGERRSHALAVDQSPGTHRKLQQVLRLRSQARDEDRQPPLEIGL